ncbi:MAG: LTA synthase family protein [Deferrisomatales bacterium]
MRVRAGAVWLLATPLFFGVAHGVAWWAFDVRLEARAVALDLGLHWLLAAGLLALSRRAGGFLALQALVTGVLCLGNGAKMAFLGGPVVPDDLLALRNLFELLDGGRWFAATLLLVAPPAIFLFNLRLGRRGYPALAAFGALALVLAFRPAWVLGPLDRHLGHVVWDAQGNYRSRGPVAHLLQETARHLADREPAPGNREVLTAALTLLGGGSVPRVARQPQWHRNVHLVVLESFWDPSPLTAARFSRDPLDEGFRALWERAGRSEALSPVFGGYTANAEFEALCGFPVVHDGVKFERLLVIDGRSGPLPVGSMPLYELPRLILERTGCELPEIFDYTCPPPGLRVRPVPGATLVLLEHGAEELCRGAGEGPCDRAARWLTQVLTVKQDRFTGHQHALAPLRPAVLAGTGADAEGDGAGDGG